MGRFQYNPVSNRWEKTGTVSGTDNPPAGFTPTVGATYVDTVTGETKQVVGQGSPDRVVSTPKSTTTVPKPKTAPSTTTPKPKVSPSTTTTVPKGQTPTTVKPKISPSTTVAPATSTTVAPEAASTGRTGPTSRVDPKPPANRIEPPATSKDAPQDTTVQDAVTAALTGGVSDSLLSLLLGGGGSGGGGGGPSTAQRVATARQAGKKNLALANKFYGRQQQQAQAAIDAATAELMANMQAPTAYTNTPLVTVPPALQGLQQNLLAYGGTGADATAQAAQDQQAADMYTALAKSGATQMAQAETAYFNALKNAALQAQTAGRQGVAANVADLKNQVMLQNLQALINAQS